MIFATLGNNELFVPALLNMHCLRMIKKTNFHVSFYAPIPHVVIKFPDGGPRRGIFCALTCFLVSTNSVFPAPFTSIPFEVPNFPGIVTLIDTLSSVLSFYQKHLTEFV